MAYAIQRPLATLQRRDAHTDPILRMRAASSVPKDHSFSPSHAHHLLDQSPHRSLFAHSNWLLFHHSQNNLNRRALQLFSHTHRSGAPFDDGTLSCVLKASACLSDPLLGRQLHGLSFKCGHESGVGVATSLIDMYMKCASVEDGRRVFDLMPWRNGVSWTSLLSGYAENGRHDSVLELFFQMLVEGIRPNPFTFATVLAAPVALGAAEKGKQVHGQLIKLGYESPTFVCNSLLNMYSKCGLIDDARQAFETMESRDAVSWNAMIAGFATNGLDLEALELFYWMRVAGVKPTMPSFATVIKFCANLRELLLARQLHCCMLKDGFGSDSNFMTSLMVAYSKCSEMDDAFELFSTMSGARDVVLWTAIISGYTQNGNMDRSALLFNDMRREDVRPNDFTYATVLAAYPAISPFQIHAQIIKADYLHVPFVGTALLNAYAKIGESHEALSVFRKIDEKNVVSWSAMLAVYAQAGDSEGAVKLFSEMAINGLKPNEFTLSSILNACASHAAPVEQGKQFHAISIKFRYHDTLCVSNALITMYAKKGSIESAQGVFERQSERDLVSWNSIVYGYAQHGNGKRALEIFRDMESRGLEMDGITFTCVIMACTHAGLVEKGRRYFNSMVKEHRISPTMEHYACMVDLFSRAGQLEEAMDIIKGMPFPPGDTVWRTLLGACRVYRNVELGKLAAENLISLEPNDSAVYVLLSNIYASAGKWDERTKIRKLMDNRKVKKVAGYSWIQVKNKIHSFLASDRSHPLSDEIYAKLEEMTLRLKEEGHRPDTEFVLHDMEEEHKEAMLAQHSERLALAFGLIATPQEVPLQIVKNLRVCGDCHSMIKLISKIEGREILIRDSNRFHHFQDGSCSCGDYW